MWWGWCNERRRKKKYCSCCRGKFIGLHKNVKDHSKTVLGGGLKHEFIIGSLAGASEKGVL